MFEPILPGCSIYLMKYVNKSPSSTRVSSAAADSAFFVDFGAGQIRFVPYIVGIYFVWRLITGPVLQHNLQWDGRLRLICSVIRLRVKLSQGTESIADKPLKSADDVVGEIKYQALLCEESSVLSRSTMAQMPKVEEIILL